MVVGIMLGGNVLVKYETPQISTNKFGLVF